MDIIQSILADKASDLLGALTVDAAYTTDEAERFLPEAGGAVREALAAKAMKMDLTDPTSVSNILSVLDAVDVAGLAERTGVSAERGTTGLIVLVPMLLGFLGRKSQGGGLLSLLGGGEGPDSPGDANDLAGKLFS